MKNTLLALTIALTAAFSAQAQETSSELKPVAGDRTIEAGTSLFLGDNYYYNSGVALQYRKFTSDTHAYRLSASAYANNTDDDNGTTSTFAMLTIAPGIERHFAGTSRLSPFIGAELPISMSYSRYEDNDQIIKGGSSSSGHNREFKAIGLVALAGVDFYVVKHFYVGLEFGAGISYRHLNDSTIDYKEPSQADQVLEGGRSISFSTLSNSGLRIGFVF